MSETMKAAVETPEQIEVATTDVVVAQSSELTDAELENVAGGLLDNLLAKCEISGQANILSSNVAIELG